MTGPEHYACAESDLEHAAHASDRDRLDDMAYWLGRAQVHATLALAAATALPGQHPGDWEREIWAFSPEDAPEVTP